MDQLDSKKDVLSKSEKYFHEKDNTSFFKAGNIYVKVLSLIDLFQFYMAESQIYNIQIRFKWDN